MGFSNGTSKVDKRKRVEKSERGQRGVGFHLTADNHYHLRNKRLTNVAAPIEGTDAVTKRFVTDLLKTRPGTTYLKNELDKKVNKSTLSDYVLKSDLRVTCCNGHLYLCKIGKIDFLKICQEEGFY